MAVAGLEFEGYFQAIARHDRRSSNFYTLTDVENKPHFYDMGFMVQTPQPKQPVAMPFAEKQEKVERFTVLEGIRKYANEHVLLIGKPGSGKSTALQQLLLEEAELCLKAEKRKIPVLIELRSWRTSVVDLIQKFFRKHKLRLSTDNIDNLLFEEQLFLLFDGLNELPSDEARREVADFRENNPQIPMIFTTRDLGVGGDLGINKQLEMQPLTEQQMRSFVTAYLPQQGDEMLRQLGDRLRELGQTPLILKMLCEVFDFAKQVPKSRGALFRGFDREFDKLKGVVPIAEGLGRWKSELLQHLAFVMMQGENPKEKPTDFRLSISRGKAEAVLEDFLKNRVDSPGQKAKDWLQDLLKHYLIQTGADREQIEFHHQLFQEYYAAEYLRKLLPSLSDGKLKHDYLNLLKWTEPLALMLGLVEDEAQAVRVVRLALVDVDLMLGARLAGEVKQDFQEKTVGLIKQLNIDEQIKVELLTKTRLDKAITILHSKVNQLDLVKSGSVAHKLRKIYSKQSVEKLIQALQHKDSSVRQSAAQVLGQICSNTAISALVQAFNDKCPRVRENAVYALGNIGSDVAVSILVQALKDDDSIVRTRAANALLQIGSYAVVSALIQSLKDENSFVRSIAAEVLGRISLDISVLPLVQALTDEDLYVRSSAAESLGKIGSQEAVSALVNALNDKYSYVRRNAAIALGKIRSEQAVFPLLQALRHKDLFLRRNAAIALGEIGSEKAVFALMQILKNEAPFVRQSAAYALGKIASDVAVYPLIKALQDENSGVRYCAIDALGKITNDKAIEPLIAMLKDEESNVCWRAAEALKNMACSENLPQMWQLLLAGQNEVKKIILNIQERYKFYNYEIFNYYIVEENKTESQPYNLQNTYNFYGNAGILNTGDVTVEGNQIGEQHKK